LGLDLFGSGIKWQIDDLGLYDATTDIQVNRLAWDGMATQNVAHGDAGVKGG
jgi:hypothetical protein